MQIEFCIRDKAHYEVAKAIFAGEPNISVSHTTITKGAHPVLISAGNSFGEMNGGVDAYINSHLSSYTPDTHIERSVKANINKFYMGELSVGTSIIVPTQHPFHHLLIYSPTMRVAEDVSESLNAYLAFRSALLIMKNNRIEAASCPLFCSGAGCMDVAKSCRQMKEAYHSVAQGNLIGGDWKVYHSHHRHLLGL
jgi:O-acetyl-ADP-ribose deacetylase (regulator of RNase III)